LILKSGTVDYIASDWTTKMWDTATAWIYINDIFWIGRDDWSELTQIKSKSINNDEIITLEAVWEWTNMLPSFVDMANMEFLSLSNNDLWNTWTQTDSLAWYYNLSRKWKAQETWELWTLNLDFDVWNINFDVPNTSTWTNYYYTYDSNGNGLLADETPQIMTNISWNIWRIAWTNINNGRTFTISTLATDNNIPTNISLSNNTVNENVVSWTTVWTLSSTDADVWDTHTYSFVTWAWSWDNALFTITWSTLKINTSPDFESKNSYSIRIDTNDWNGWTYQKQFTINIANLWESINTIIDFEIPGKYTVTSGTWTRTTNNPQEWIYSLESNNGLLPNTQSCFIVNNTFNGTWTIDFKYNVSSQLWADYLWFYIDNVSQNTWSGTIAWSTYTKNNVVAWTHEYKWCYIKDWATNVGTDNAWVDYITFADTTPVWDITPPNISSLNFSSGTLLPWWNHNLIINYTDTGSWIDTSSDTIALYQWNGVAWWSDISATWLNLWSKVITTTSATYPTNNLAYWKYKYDFQISDIVTNSSSTWAVFYIDEPEIIVSSGSLDIWDVNNGVTKFSSGELTVTVKTVWAWYNLILNKDSSLTDWTVNISDWNGVDWFWYDKNPYTSSINLINTNEIIATQTWSININWNKNTYIYTIKFWTLIWPEQTAWNYEWLVRFWLILDY
jgi:hypothetical protein